MLFRSRRDRNQNEISETIINDDLTFDGGMPEIKVAVELWRKVSGVTFELHYSGDPNPGYMVGTLTSVPEEITLAGTSEAIHKNDRRHDYRKKRRHLVEHTGISYCYMIYCPEIKDNAHSAVQ